MLWRICQHFDKGLEEVTGDPEFPDDEILDVLHAHETIVRQRVQRLLAGLCLNVMDVLQMYGLLDHSVLKVYRRCYFVGQDLVLTKI